MQPWTARAFLMRMLNQDQKDQLRKHESTLPRGRYLQGFEICKAFKLKPNTLNEDAVASMERLLTGFIKNKEYKHLNKHRISDDISEVVECDCKTDNEALYEWEEFADRMFEDSLDWNGKAILVWLSIGLFMSNL